MLNLSFKKHVESVFIILLFQDDTVGAEHLVNGYSYAAEVRKNKAVMLN